MKKYAYIVTRREVNKERGKIKKYISQFDIFC